MMAKKMTSTWEIKEIQNEAKLGHDQIIVGVGFTVVLKLIDEQLVGINFSLLASHQSVSQKNNG